ncbi:hypothetical protein ScalyP_jg6775 [Parmales sp. scaly parma]|nr:hypothetical protein ScalyP_jg6775 [Parmales sp. scaly parma]
MHRFVIAERLFVPFRASLRQVPMAFWASLGAAHIVRERFPFFPFRFGLVLLRLDDVKHVVLVIRCVAYAGSCSCNCSSKFHHPQLCA